MSRKDNFLFRYPGFPSLSIPYHDSNDFYYSGHVGTCFVLVLEARAKRWYRLSWMCFFIMLNQWSMLMLVRAHYIIDMVTSLAVAHYMHMLAEKVSYLVDVLWMRQHLTKPDLRERYNWKPCRECGWSNRCAKDYLPREEKLILRQIYDQQRELEKKTTKNEEAETPMQKGVEE
jgi:hypothetical protein